MLSKKVIKDIQSLGHKKFREETGLFVAEGPKIVSELIKICPEKLQHVYATEEWLEAGNAHERLEVISDAELTRISFLKAPNQVLAVLEQFDVKEPVVNGFVLYLDAIQDPGNFGTIIRIADWFGVSHVVCSEGCADLYNPKVIQSTMASIARVHVFYDHGHRWLQNQAALKFAATLDGEPLQKVEKATAGILIIGNESRGISDEVLQMADKKITIPRKTRPNAADAKGNAESLNAAVATGIILSHLI